MTIFQGSLKMAQAITLGYVLIVGGACSLEKVEVIHKTPVKGMEGYEVTIREAHEPEIKVYQGEGIYIQELGSYESPPSAKAQETPAELAPVSQEPAPLSLRRQRIPLRRRRDLLLKEQTDSSF